LIQSTQRISEQKVAQLSFRRGGVKKPDQPYRTEAKSLPPQTVTVKRGGVVLPLWPLCHISHASLDTRTFWRGRQAGWLEGRQLLSHLIRLCLLFLTGLVKRILIKAFVCMYAGMSACAKVRSES